MIQRIQSIFLLLAAAAFGGLFALPFASSDKISGSIFGDGLFNIYDHTILLALAIIGAVVAVVSIFLFKNRPLQLRLGYLVIIVSLFLPAMAAWIFFTQKEQIAQELVVEDSIGLYLPIVSFVFGILAARSISKDDKLVKSMDRLR